jgi:hypothetical protein
MGPGGIRGVERGVSGSGTADEDSKEEVWGCTNSLEHRGRKAVGIDLVSGTRYSSTW